MLTYKEIWAELAKLEEEYNELKQTGKPHQQKFASNAGFVLAKVDRAFREKMKEKYGKKKHDEKDKTNLWSVW